MVILAAAVSLWIVSYYLYACFKKGVEPHAYTWLIWGLTMMVSLIAQYEGGAGFALFATIFMLVSCFVIAAVGFLRNRNVIARIDTWCLLICLAAIAVIPFLHTALYSIVLMTAVDIAGYYPSIRKTWHKPHTENAMVFAMVFIEQFLLIAAIENYNILTTLYPFAVGSTSLLFAFMIIGRKHYLANQVGTSYAH